MATLAVFSPTKLIEISEPQLKDMKRAELEAFCAALADAAQRQDTAIVMLLGEEELQTADYRAAQGALFRALADAAQLSSIADETAEGRSIVVLAKERFNIRGRDLSAANAEFIEFSAKHA